MSTTPDNPVEGGEAQRQARIAQGDALTPAGAVRTNFAGDLEGGFLGVEFAPFVVNDPNRPPDNLIIPVTEPRLQRRLRLMRDLERPFECEGGAEPRAGR